MITVQWYMVQWWYVCAAHTLLLAVRLLGANKIEPVWQASMLVTAYRDSSAHQRETS